MNRAVCNRFGARVPVGLILLISCAPSAHGPTIPNEQPNSVPMTTKLGEREAVALAERFIAENGYTDLPGTKNEEEMSRESLDDGDPAARRRFRANTLRRRACGVMFINAWSKAEGWTVVFCYNSDRYVDDLEMSKLVLDRGRAVVMGPDGKDPRILHVDIALDAAGLKRLE